MKPYLVEGYYPLPVVGRQRFRKEVAARDEKEAVEKVYSLLGSNHKVKRRFIKIESVKPLSPEEVKSPVVQYLIKKEN
ncbi:MAG: 50S ribosomal protein L18a [Thermoplasmata archaeon]|nr:50S ribosomal protein L18a [Thermoplasmata archaeon]